MRASGHGARVTCYRGQPLRALEAVMDGYRVAPIAEAARYGDLFITATGDKHVIRGEHMSVMKDGAIICNTGHFNVEIDIPALEGMAKSRRTVRDFMEELQSWLMAVSSSCWPKGGWSTCQRLKNTPPRSRT